MKAIHYSRNGSPEVMEYGDLPDPEVGSDTVLIAVEWISIEGGDLLNRLVTPPPHTPFIPGYQAAGTVSAVGKAVTRFKPGDRVIGFNWNGSHAELFAVPEHYAYPVPDDLDLRLAALIPVAFGTAHDSLFEYGDMKPGDFVLVQGAAGGVGLAAVQFASRAGATVIGTASSRERLERIVPFGLHHGIDYRTEDIAARCKEITQGKGVDLVLDLAGGQGKDALMSAVKPHGRYAVIGAATGTLPSFTFFELIRKALHVVGISFGRDMHTPRVHALLADITRQFTEGHLQMPVAAEFTLANAVEAHRHVAGEHPFGRVLMRVGA
ncbi:quinone oxidoreductase family protein [Novosphingobium mangrovi (ex Huang et al. 2023)]|uniref:Zinc-binding alcohol dehydrogenase family protein n=1 Tax=Novosphingobium mangrovi (ex Huang et al. 2023) TaxID=2976432 RepID=A0ABT2IAA0_9SPHN|nr:zinc-binding alcohol dehydrogenase family protein [Novosphingobium mangrovi (ex Huang et al. 2023)]MCT2401726.1 zinc-binding alcohol dehydrogenase family protein [Novosphingobium mangrovi (ex Huang et al. 2023)]